MQEYQKTEIENEEEIHAYIETEDNNVIRLRGHKEGDETEWTESVEVAESIHGDVISTLHSGHGLEPTAVYNQIVESLE